MISIEKESILAILKEKSDISYEEIGKRLGGISGIKVRYWCLKHGIQKPKGPWKRHTLTLSDESIRHILLQNVRKSLEETAKEIGVSRQFVRMLYLNFGIKHLGREPALHSAMRLAGEIARPDCSIVLEEAYEKARKSKISSSVMYLAIRKLSLKPLRRSDALFERGMRRCTDCKKTKPISEFYIERSNRQGLAYRCKVCSQKHTAEFHANKMR